MLALQTWGLVFSAPQITDGSKRGIAMGLKGTFFYALLKRMFFLIFPSLCFLLLGMYFAYTDRWLLAHLAWLSILFVYVKQVTIASIAEYFIAEKQFRFWSYWQILTGSFVLIFTPMRGWLTQNILVFFAFKFIFSCVLCIFGLVYLIKQKRLWHAFRLKEYDRTCIAYGIRFLPIDGVGAISNKIVDVLIGTMFGFTSLAIFSVANEMRNVVANSMKLIGSLTYADFAKKPMEDVIKKIYVYLGSMLTIGGLLTLAILPLFSWYIRTFLDSSLQDSILLFTILAIGLPLVLPIILIYTVLNAHFRYKEIALANTIPSLIKIVLVIIFGYLGGIYGMVLAMVIHSLIVFGFYYLVTIKRAWMIRVCQNHEILKKISERY
jgi:O-antigen/teichoic acid export membrane protein